MVNGRDAYLEKRLNEINNVSIPYALGTIVESKENPNSYAKIIQYRVSFENYIQVIHVGLTSNINDNKSTIEMEITSNELLDKWILADEKLGVTSNLYCDGVKLELKKNGFL